MGTDVPSPLPSLLAMSLHMLAATTNTYAARGMLASSRVSFIFSNLIRELGGKSGAYGTPDTEVMLVLSKVRSHNSACSP